MARPGSSAAATGSRAAKPRWATPAGHTWTEEQACSSGEVTQAAARSARQAHSARTAAGWLACSSFLSSAPFVRDTQQTIGLACLCSFNGVSVGGTPFKAPSALPPTALNGAFASRARSRVTNGDTAQWHQWQENNGDWRRREPFTVLLSSYAARRSSAAAAAPAWSWRRGSRRTRSQRPRSLALSLAGRRKREDGPRSLGEEKFCAFSFGFLLSSDAQRKILLHHQSERRWKNAHF